MAKMSLVDTLIGLCSFGLMDTYQKENQKW